MYFRHYYKLMLCIKIFSVYYSSGCYAIIHERLAQRIYVSSLSIRSIHTTLLDVSSSFSHLVFFFSITCIMSDFLKTNRKKYIKRTPTMDGHNEIFIQVIIIKLISVFFCVCMYCVCVCR